VAKTIVCAETLRRDSVLALSAFIRRFALFFKGIVVDADRRRFTPKLVYVEFLRTTTT
jgi:hypothetical protein